MVHAKISDKIRAAHNEGRNWWSFEYFPPRTEQGLINLYDRIGRMAALGPIFIDITWGAGGTTSDATTQFVKTAHEQFGLETNMHLTCTNMEVGMVERALKEAYDSGCRNILALRGDPPRGQEEWKATEGGFNHAIDLIKYIRKNYDDYFDIAVAGFPEGHPQASSRAEEIEHLKAKIDAGASIIITQMFYDIDTFINWAHDVRKAGINALIVPGIMPIQGWQSFQKCISFSKTIVPQHFFDVLEPIKDDDAAVREAGTKLVADMCRQILDSPFDIHGLHFYTMNLEKATSMLLEELNFTASVEITNPLPWKPSLTTKRRSESIRPIFWANRAGSYRARTESWDEFPNGRWGDSRSPAFGKFEGYGITLKPERGECLSMWGSPTTFADIASLFARFCRGEIAALPWSDEPAAKETSIIGEALAKMNLAGYLTINSQPVVDGAPSSDPVHGWGPRGGYVYQKAYLEFFCKAEQATALFKRFEAEPSITYYAVNKQGDLRTNTATEGPNAVTWGVFPCREIAQPTIVEQTSFMAWKDEAFELGSQWAKLYPAESASRELISSFFDNCYLINIVDNDYRNSSKTAIFRFFDEQKLSTSRTASTNGTATNGVH
ncbi:uncharacterized protein L969DRAFT_89200 [Mixia osmundae IAM 14324]|uniref:MTHFR SAM-binding regulatory domain-containing protein n=1 Tax=Mixia osmundae (strain CBS 9802 / IAM 14324 / JCM 22182 / KY 12970) TaxID=764103 RepID=G7DSI2_MIXOS|nr:uncharacterized protein L969DRAFT_89200 [Mixia osmundae IAM 14324]KEI37960.1 hypothetical protein L969DRAFT_89200 [Mixia osmundae IAM 14324]GAA93542.1 hypothetical protein E5Q_00186 [Mixia osmundae IAM 14324]